MNQSGSIVIWKWAPILYKVYPRLHHKIPTRQRWGSSFAAVEVESSSWAEDQIRTDWNLNDFCLLYKFVSTCKLFKYLTILVFNFLGVLYEAKWPAIQDLAISFGLVFQGR